MVERRRGGKGEKEEEGEGRKGRRGGDVDGESSRPPSDASLSFRSLSLLRDESFFFLCCFFLALPRENEFDQINHQRAKTEQQRRVKKCKRERERIDEQRRSREILDSSEGVTDTEREREREMERREKGGGGDVYARSSSQYMS